MANIFVLNVMKRLGAFDRRPPEKKTSAASPEPPEDPKAKPPGPAGSQRKD